jgi:hypothetical protein
MKNVKFWLQTTLVTIILFLPFVVSAQDAPQRTLIPIGGGDYTRITFLSITSEEAIRIFDTNIDPAPVTSAAFAQLLTTPSPTITVLQTPTTPTTIPSPANPNWVNIMIGVALISVIIIIVGVWINRE